MKNIKLMHHAHYGQNIKQQLELHLYIIILYRRRQVNKKNVK